MEYDTNNEATTKRRNYLIRLFRGEIPLVITYWVFGVLIGGLSFRLGNWYLSNNFVEIIRSPAGSNLVQTFSWVSIGFSVFILIAIWRSAARYQGRAVWKYLARLVVIGNTVFLGYTLYMATDIEYRMEKEISLLNKSLPSMLDEETRLDSVSANGRNVTYTYTLVNKAITDVRLVTFKLHMGLNLRSFNCTTEQTRMLLEQGFTLTHFYRDRHSAHIADISVTIGDCV